MTGQLNTCSNRKNSVIFYVQAIQSIHLFTYVIIQTDYDMQVQAIDAAARLEAQPQGWQ